MTVEAGRLGHPRVNLGGNGIYRAAQWPDEHSPHHGLRQEPPLRQGGHAVDITSKIERKQVLERLITEYRRAA